MIATESVSHGFEHGRVLDDVSLQVAAGEMVVLLGPNGAGKSTLLRILAGLLTPDAGAVQFAGLRLVAADAWPPTLRSQVGFVPEQAGLWGRLTVRDQLETYAALHGVEDSSRRIARAVADLDLVECETRRAAALSKGMQQKVSIARALLHGPGVLLLDEPTAGLDPVMTHDVLAAIARARDEGCAVVMATHDLSDAERLASRLVVLRRRVLWSGSPSSMDRGPDPAALIVELESATAATQPALEAALPTLTVRRAPAQAHGVFRIEGPRVTDRTPDVVAALVASGHRLRRVEPERPSLEAFYRRLLDDDTRGHGGAPEREPERQRPSTPAARARPREDVERRRVQPSTRRLRALVAKEWRESRWQAGVWLPLLVSMSAAVLPAVAVGAWPWLDGVPLERDDLALGPEVERAWPALMDLGSRAAAQAVLFSEFLYLLVLAPVTSAAATVAHSMAAERTGRSIEPLLASPVAAVDVIGAKVIGALVPALVVGAAGVTLFGLVVLSVAEPGVMAALMTWRSWTIVMLLGPAMTLGALQATLWAGTRAADARTAQHAGAPMALVCSGLLVAEASGLWFGTAGVLAGLAMGLVLVWLGLWVGTVWDFSRARLVGRRD